MSDTSSQLSAVIRPWSNNNEDMGTKKKDVFYLGLKQQEILGWREKGKKWARKMAKGACSKKQLYRKLPFLDWLPKYTVEKAVSDLVAGITVGLTVIPQGIAYALLAELPPQYGLYSAFMGCFAYIVFGSCKDITVGPTALMALMTAEHAREKGPDSAVLLSFLSGIVVLLLGTFRLGFVIDFISTPVISGFTSAAAVTIASSQLKALFGLTLGKKKPSTVVGLTGTWIDVVRGFDTIRYQDTVLGFVCIIALILMRSLKDVKWFSSSENDNLCRKILSKTVWLISTGRNAFVVLICLGMAYGFDPELPADPKSRNTTFLLTGRLESGIPPFHSPPFEIVIPKKNETLDFGETLDDFGIAIITIPLIAILEHVAIAKAFASGQPVDANQEMIALGFCSFLGSFVRSMPTTGSFSRTAVNAASGVRTPLGGIYTGILVLLALAVFMPACAYIPKATLAAVIITAVMFSIEYEVIKPMYKSKKIDVLFAFATFLCCCFWNLEYGIIVCVVMQAIYLLYNAARPGLEVEEGCRLLQLTLPDNEYVTVRVDRALHFPSVAYARNLINKVGLRQARGKLPVLVDCQHVFATDFTGAIGFGAMAVDFKKRGQALLFVNVGKDVEHTLLGSGRTDIVIMHSEMETKQRLQEIFSIAPHEEKDEAAEDQATTEDEVEKKTWAQIRNSP